MDLEEDTVSLCARKSSRFTVEPVKESLGYSSKSLGEHPEGNKLVNYYYKDSTDNVFDPYALFMSLNYPLDKGKERSRLEKFQSYWENESFYAIWRNKFIKEHSCEEQDMWKEFFISSVPHLIINLYLICYIVFGAVIFQVLDEGLSEHKLYEVILFTFTTIATIGYGDLVPTNDLSKLFCIFYTLIGVPSLFLSLTNIGQFLAEAYWILLASLKKKRELEASDGDDSRLPLPIVIILLLLLSVIGGFLFHFWIDQRPIIPAIYFSFVSITTIGFGDITPTPDGWMQTLIVIFYLATGMVVMSTFVTALLNYLRKLHYLGRNFSGAAHVEVWFGGTKMSIAELLHIVASHFEVSPKVLYDVLRDLDDIITAATEPSIDNSFEVEQRGEQPLSKSTKSLIDVDNTTGRRRPRFIQVRDRRYASEKRVLIKPESNLRIDTLREDERGNVMHALSMLHHITTTKSNIRDQQRRASTGSWKLRSCKTYTPDSGHTLSK